MCIQKRLHFIQDHFNQQFQSYLIQLLTSYEYPFISLQQNHEIHETHETTDEDEEEEDGIYRMEEEKFERVINEFSRYHSFIHSLYPTQDSLPNLLKVMASFDL